MKYTILGDHDLELSDFMKFPKVGKVETSDLGSLSDRPVTKISDRSPLFLGTFPAAPPRPSKPPRVPHAPASRTSPTRATGSPAHPLSP